MMTKHLVLLLLVAATCPTWCQTTFPSRVEGRVVSVKDGDTLVVLHNNQSITVRLYGIDAPELKQDFGQQAKAKLSTLVLNKTVRVDRRGTGKDNYGRMIGEVFVGSKSANVQLVETGMAWWYYRYADNDKALQRAEQKARDRRLGLWSKPNPVAPWEFRRITRS